MGRKGIKRKITELEASSACSSEKNPTSLPQSDNSNFSLQEIYKPFISKLMVIYI
jgi:hypothetical protein